MVFAISFFLLFARLMRYASPEFFIQPIFIPMTVDYLIIGQGICGTWLSYYLLRAGGTVLVIDKANDKSASNVASGLINPVTGRRVVTTWMADELLPFVRNEYDDINKRFHVECIAQKNILVFPSAPDLQHAFNKRMNEGNSYIFPSPVDKEELREHFNFPFDVMEIAPCYLVDVRELIKRWRTYLQSEHALIEDDFNEEKLFIGDASIQYEDVRAKKIIYCNGIQATSSRYWHNLPFVPNKGQALIASIPKLRRDHMYKLGYITIIPWGDDLWWIGSSNERGISN
jgi:glycine/D-amino acid oxidase-like deaminating enzyme